MSSQETKGSNVAFEPTAPHLQFKFINLFLYDLVRQQEMSCKNDLI